MKKKAALDGNDRKRQGMWKDVWRRFRKNKAAMLGEESAVRLAADLRGFLQGK